ncbi:MAG TPA: RidA family protein, partial [Paracoccaceae bacterium]|nr:RidA family protein [Paracoccaceae bacterium]
MSNAIDKRLAELSIVLPDAPAPAANYVPYVQAGDLVHISGQVSKDATGLITGKLGADFDQTQGYAAARVCALNLIAQLKAACGGDLSRVKRVVRLGGFVNATPEFTAHPQV